MIWRLVAWLLPLAMSASVAMADEPYQEPLDALVKAQINAGAVPGAVVAIGDVKHVQFLKAYGQRSVQPAAEAMSTDTIFDLASLTKVVATTTAVMQLVEQGRLELDAPVARYWPAFSNHGKAEITIRQLLSHSSGLRPDLDMRQNWSGTADAVRRIEQEAPLTLPGTRVRYSDINFAALGVLVERISGMPLAVYCQRFIFAPLGMRDTAFLPAPALWGRIAPTEPDAGGVMRRGRVHDPMAERMGGKAGHAGLFGTAADLVRFAQALLNGGRLGTARILQPQTVAQLGMAQPPGGADARGLGWKLEAPLVANRDSLPARGLLSHTGYTGTGMWIDLAGQRFVIILTNRVHPDGHGNAGPLRKQVLALLANSVPPRRVAVVEPPPVPPSNGEDKELRVPSVLTGIDVLEQRHFAPLAGRNVGLITSLSGLDLYGRRTLDALRWAPDVKLVALFSPEHGLYGAAEGRVASNIEPISGLPVFSLYGAERKPSPAMLAGIDALVFDLQDAGVRFYTYLSTLGYTLEAAAAAHMPVYVLDRPNPIGAARPDGPMLDAERSSFTGYFPMPVEHGMTLGELAQLINAQKHLGADLHVIAMQNYRRKSWFDQTGLDWVPPSPNLRTLTEAALYPGVALVEGANVSVGRGTAHPFELVGAPWVDAAGLARYLNARAISGVRFAPAEFIPIDSVYRGRLCHGVRIELRDRQALRAPRLGVELASALWRLYPQHFQLERTLGLIGSAHVLAQIRAGEDPSLIEQGWQPGLAQFETVRSRYLLY